MKLVVGLGNPGDKYDRTRHNVGFWVIDALAERLNAPCNKAKWKALVGECMVGKEKVILCKPQTFMNLSGESVRAIIDFYGDLQPQTDVVLVYDDMDFAVGQCKLRERGSAGGHNGVKSVIQHLGTDQFPRVRVGIGRPPGQQPVVDYVLTPFPKADQEHVKAAVQRASDAVEFALHQTFSLAMNRFNTSADGPLS